MNERYEFNGDVLRQYLKREGRKHSWLIAHLQVSASLLSKMLNLGHVPSEETVELIVSITGIPKETLLLPRKSRRAAS